MPKMWNRGSTPSTTSSGRSPRPGCACICSRFECRLPCVSIAAFAEPAVPLVKSRAARSSAEREATGAGSAVRRSSNVAASVNGWPAVPMTSRTDGTAARSTSPQLARPAGPTITAVVSTDGDLAHELGSRAERVQRDHDAADPEHGEIRDRRTWGCWRRAGRPDRRGRARVRRGRLEAPRPADGARRTSSARPCSRARRRRRHAAR